jgi:hypothetical protein
MEPSKPARTRGGTSNARRAITKKGGYTNDQTQKSFKINEKRATSAVEPGNRGKQPKKQLAKRSNP